MKKAIQMIIVSCFILFSIHVQAGSIHEKKSEELKVSAQTNIVLSGHDAYEVLDAADEKNIDLKENEILEPSKDLQNNESNRESQFSDAVENETISQIDETDLPQNEEKEMEDKSEISDNQDHAEQEPEPEKEQKNEEEKNSEIEKQEPENVVLLDGEKYFLEEADFSFINGKKTVDLTAIFKKAKANEIILSIETNEIIHVVDTKLQSQTRDLIFYIHQNKAKVIFHKDVRIDTITTEGSPYNELGGILVAGRVNKIVIGDEIETISGFQNREGVAIYTDQGSIYNAWVTVCGQAGEIFIHGQNKLHISVSDYNVASPPHATTVIGAASILVSKAGLKEASIKKIVIEKDISYSKENVQHILTDEVVIGAYNANVEEILIKGNLEFQTSGTAVGVGLYNRYGNHDLASIRMDGNCRLLNNGRHSLHNLSLISGIFSYYYRGNTYISPTLKSTAQSLQFTGNLTIDEGASCRAGLGLLVIQSENKTYDSSMKNLFVESKADAGLASIKGGAPRTLFGSVVQYPKQSDNLKLSIDYITVKGSIDYNPSSYGPRPEDIPVFHTLVGGSHATIVKKINVESDIGISLSSKLDHTPEKNKTERPQFNAITNLAEINEIFYSGNLTITNEANHVMLHGIGPLTELNSHEKGFPIAKMNENLIIQDGSKIRIKNTSDQTTIISAVGISNVNMLGAIQIGEKQKGQPYRTTITVSSKGNINNVIGNIVDKQLSSEMKLKNGVQAHALIFVDHDFLESGSEKKLKFNLFSAYDSEKDSELGPVYIHSNQHDTNYHLENMYTNSNLLLNGYVLETKNKEGFILEQTNMPCQLLGGNYVVIEHKEDAIFSEIPFFKQPINILQQMVYFHRLYFSSLGEHTLQAISHRPDEPTYDYVGSDLANYLKKFQMEEARYEQLFFPYFEKKEFEAVRIIPIQKPSYSLDGKTIHIFMNETIWKINREFSFKIQNEKNEIIFESLKNNYSLVSKDKKELTIDLSEISLSKNMLYTMIISPDQFQTELSTIKDIEDFLIPNKELQIKFRLTEDIIPPDENQYHASFTVPRFFLGSLDPGKAEALGVKEKSFFFTTNVRDWLIVTDQRNMTVEQYEIFDSNNTQVEQYTFKKSGKHVFKIKIKNEIISVSIDVAELQTKAMLEMFEKDHKTFYLDVINNFSDLNKDEILNESDAKIVTETSHFTCKRPSFVQAQFFITSNGRRISSEINVPIYLVDIDFSLTEKDVYVKKNDQLAMDKFVKSNHLYYYMKQEPNDWKGVLSLKTEIYKGEDLVTEAVVFNEIGTFVFHYKTKCLGKEKILALNVHVKDNDSGDQVEIRVENPTFYISLLDDDGKEIITSIKKNPYDFVQVINASEQDLVITDENGKKVNREEIRYNKAGTYYYSAKVGNIFSDFTITIRQLNLKSLTLYLHVDQTMNYGQLFNDFPRDHTVKLKQGMIYENFNPVDVINITQRGLSIISFKMFDGEKEISEDFFAYVRVFDIDLSLKNLSLISQLPPTYETTVKKNTTINLRQWIEAYLMLDERVKDLKEDVQIYKNDTLLNQNDWFAKENATFRYVLQYKGMKKEVVLHLIVKDDSGGGGGGGGGGSGDDHKKKNPTIVGVKDIFICQDAQINMMKEIRAFNYLQNDITEKINVWDAKNIKKTYEELNRVVVFKIPGAYQFLVKVSSDGYSDEKSFTITVNDPAKMVGITNKTVETGTNMNIKEGVTAHNSIRDFSNAIQIYESNLEGDLIKPANIWQEFHKSGTYHFIFCLDTPCSSIRKMLTITVMDKKDDTPDVPDDKDNGKKPDDPKKPDDHKKPNGNHDNKDDGSDKIIPETRHRQTIFYFWKRYFFLMVFVFLYIKKIKLKKA